ncbi:hypothetical protein [Methylomagnum sp.]
MANAVTAMEKRVGPVARLLGIVLELFLFIPRSLSFMCGLRIEPVAYATEPRVGVTACGYF